MAAVDVSQEAAKGADLWSIFDLTGFIPEEAYSVYKNAAEHDTPFSFPVTLKDKSEAFTMVFRSVLCSIITDCQAICRHICLLILECTSCQSYKPVVSLTHRACLQTLLARQQPLCTVLLCFASFVYC